MLVVEFDDTDNAVFEEIMQILRRSSNFTKLSLEDKHILSVPGLEINIQQRKVYCDNLNLRKKLASKSKTRTFEILCSREVGYYFDVLKEESG